MTPELAQVEAYWHGLKAGPNVPRRSDVDPRGIRGALPYAFILEKIAPGLARFRLAGAHLNDLIGMEVRGMPLTTFFAPQHRPEVSDLVTRLFEAPEIIEMEVRSPRTLGRSEMTGRMLLLPLRSDLGDISRALGCFVTDGSIGRVPRRFAPVKISAKPALGDAPVVEGAPHLAEARPGFSEAATPFASTRPPRGKPRLRLVKTNDD